LHQLPWKITGEKPSRWRRYVWQLRLTLYINELNAKIERERTQVNQHFQE